MVVECKSPTVSEPMAEAIDQLRRYHNARKDAGEVEEAEGVERLFYTNQFLVATSYDASPLRHHRRRGGPLRRVEGHGAGAPRRRAGRARQDDVVEPKQTHRGDAPQAHLLDLIRHFTIYQPAGGRIVKVVSRYQQFRAVHAAIHRLRTGATRKQHGEFDLRGGIIWHTQGSGKSLTMVFLVRKMRSMPDLRRFKVVIVTDRRTSSGSSRVRPSSPARRSRWAGTSKR